MFQPILLGFTSLLLDQIVLFHSYFDVRVKKKTKFFLQICNKIGRFNYLVKVDDNESFINTFNY